MKLKFTKKIKKILAGAALAGLAAYGYHRYRKSKYVDPVTAEVNRFSKLISMNRVVPTRDKDWKFSDAAVLRNIDYENELLNPPRQAEVEYFKPPDDPGSRLRDAMAEFYKLQQS